MQKGLLEAEQRRILRERARAIIRNRSWIRYSEGGDYSARAVKNLSNVDNLVKSPKTVMPDLIRHPEVIEFTGFRLSPE